jgi:hypothetical protein
MVACVRLEYTPTDTGKLADSPGRGTRYRTLQYASFFNRPRDVRAPGVARHSDAGIKKLMVTVARQSLAGKVVAGGEPSQHSAPTYARFCWSFKLIPKHNLYYNLELQNISGV